MRWLAVSVILLLLSFLAWPYAVLVRLDAAVTHNDTAALASIVDIDTIRAEIRKKLNKEVDTSVGEVSNAFVEWLQQGIRRLGNRAVQQIVTMEWVRQALLSKSPPGGPPSMLSEVTYAFFDSPDGFLVRIGALGNEPVHLRLTLRDLRWRVTAVYN